ncbi:hypothetical protein [Mycobacterium sp.]|uniref:hypothetical protein n=1 Tax=Mycobacterium sp. TaxID=1785 RepID=UPI0025FD3413|nr:hypothetical protein [Mycobacterium sp.]
MKYRKACSAKEFQSTQVQDELVGLGRATLNVIGEQGGIGSVEFAVCGDHGGRWPTVGDETGGVVSLRRKSVMRLGEPSGNRHGNSISKRAFVLWITSAASMRREKVPHVLDVVSGRL